MGKRLTKPEAKGRGLPVLPAKPNEVVFAPSILSSDFANLERDIRKLRRAGVRWVHVDVMDGHFVPNLTLGPPILRCLKRAVPDMFYDAHLMVENPLRLVRDFVQAGASLITIHAEACEDPTALCRYIRRQRVGVGASVRPKTAIRVLQPVLHLVDLVLIMTVEPGFGGQEILPQTINKIREIRQIRSSKKLGFLIQIDGGVTTSNVRLLAAAGAEVIVAGTAVFRDGAVRENLRVLRQALAGSPSPEVGDTETGS